MESPNVAGECTLKDVEQPGKLGDVVDNRLHGYYVVERDGRIMTIGSNR